MLIEHSSRDGNTKRATTGEKNKNIRKTSIIWKFRNFGKIAHFLFAQEIIINTYLQIAFCPSKENCK